MKRSLISVIALAFLLFTGCNKESLEKEVTPKTMAQMNAILNEMPANERPQFILITFDDAVHGPAIGYTDKVFKYGHKNPNGSPIPLVYYVSLEYTDYHMVQQRYAAGCEIAVHTMTHTTGINDSYDKWRAEITGCRTTLSNLARIPLQNINGFRAPFLAHSEHSFQVLWEEGFLYESSVTEQIGKNSKDVRSFIFPYDMQQMGVQNYSVGRGPTSPLPGLWEIPMWGWHNDANQLIANMDPPGNYDLTISMFNNTFDTRYSSNRAPMGIFLHPGWLSDDAHAKALNDFLTRSLAKQGVWVVTGQQLIEWMKNPKTISEMNGWDKVQWNRPASGAEVPDGWDNDGDGSIDEGFVKTCNYGSYHFQTTADQCPDVYPAPFVEVSRKINASVRGTIIGTTPCPNPIWQSGKAYEGGAKVTYNKKSWTAKWYATETPGANQWGAWSDDGVCESDIIETNGTITPSGTVRVGDKKDTVFTITPKAGYRIADVLVNGKSVGALNRVTFTNVTADQSIEALFELDDNAVFYNVTASATTGGTITPAGSSSVRENSSVTYAVAASAGYRIADVKVNGVSKGALASIKIDSIKANTTVEASFTAIPKFTVDVLAYSNGTVTPGDSSIYEGSSLNYTFAPAAGYRIADVKVNGVSKGAITSFAVTSIAANVTIEPIFELIPLIYDTVAITASAGGTVSGNAIVLRSTSPVYTFTPAAGNRVASVVLNGVSKGSVNSLTIANISGNQTLNVTFEPIPVIFDTVVATATAGGTITPAGTTIMERGTNKSFTITANSGYELTSLKLNGVAQTLGSSLTISNISGNKTIEATFSAIVYHTVRVVKTGNGTISTDTSFQIRSGRDTTIAFTPATGYKIGTVALNGTDKGAVSSLTLSKVAANQTVAVQFVVNTSSPCDGVKVWSASESWTAYKVGDKRTNGGKLWQCKAPGYAFYEPSGSWGHLGWTSLGLCQ